MCSRAPRGGRRARWHRAQLPTPAAAHTRAACLAPAAVAAHRIVAGGDTRQLHRQAQPRPTTLYGNSEDPARSTHSKMALARRDLSGKPAHAMSEVSTAACSRPHSSHAHTTLYRDGLWLLTGDVCKGTCCRRRLDDAVCSRHVEEVVAAGLQTCSAHVCMTHVRTAARSHTHRDQLSNASAAHFVREDEDPCKMTYSRMALIERGPSLLQTKASAMHPCVMMQLLCTQPCSCEPPARQATAPSEHWNCKAPRAASQRRQPTERAKAARMTAAAASI